MKLSLCTHLIVLSCLFLVEGKAQWEPGASKPAGIGGLCRLPPKTGPCKASIPMFYFNPKANKCLQFIYGGCGGNANRFDSKEECKRKCMGWKPTPDPDVCRMPKKVGPCKASIPKFYFDSTSGRCLKFTYGGCQGNGNNFDSKQECEKRCGSHHGWKPPAKPTGKPVACSMPAEVGLCKAALPRFYFNSNLGKCLPFKYGGCGGNANRFRYKDECEQRCGKKYNRQKDPCLTLTKRVPWFTRENSASALWHYDAESETCKKSKLAKPARNVTTFPSCSVCVKTCRTHMHSIQDCGKEKLPE